MIRPIVLYGSLVLRRVADHVASDYRDLKSLVEDMFETTYEASGIGLAAPQIDVPIRLFVISGKLSEMKELIDYEEVFINPQIEELSKEKQSYEEGCLSLPGIRGSVSRPERVVLSYENINREQRKIQANGMLARIIQHEYDHLEGRLFIDYFSSIQRRRTKRKLSQIGKDSCSYPVAQTERHHH